VSALTATCDVLFDSCAPQLGKNALGVLLTGMGNDGCAGNAPHEAGGELHLAQDETNSVVFGMPRESIRLRAVDQVLPLGRIGSVLLEVLCRA